MLWKLYLCLNIGQIDDVQATIKLIWFNDLIKFLFENKAIFLHGIQFAFILSANVYAVHITTGYNIRLCVPEI